MIQMLLGWPDWDLPVIDAGQLPPSACWMRQGKDLVLMVRAGNFKYETLAVVPASAPVRRRNYLAYRNLTARS